MTIQPLRNFVLVEPVVRQLSNVIWCDNRENLCNGYIVAKGPQAQAVQLGDFVAYGGEQYLNWPIIYDENKKYQLINEMDICAIIEGE